ncbi:hypothetical protein [Paenibacillus mendelii]|uniref:Uncharacterized protein n=1 Tax=Paenibacillus mendelii TaxID=206163 RepID=A0ABV6JAR6_9BACL|nr:hypothetical protein [Paenibacillus mendelii]
MEIILPHRAGYEFGIGIDRLSGAAKNTVVTGDPTTVQYSPGSVQSFNVTRIRTSHDLQRHLGPSTLRRLTAVLPSEQGSPLVSST